MTPLFEESLVTVAVIPTVCPRSVCAEEEASLMAIGGVELVQPATKNSADNMRAPGRKERVAVDRCDRFDTVTFGVFVTKRNWACGAENTLDITTPGTLASWP